MKENTSLKYLIIKQNLVKKIDGDVFKAGQLIPSEHELSEQYDVSRITVRKALSELEHEGYLYKVQGKGTFVKGKTNRQPTVSLASSTQDIIRMGMTPSRQVLEIGVEGADSQRQNALNLSDRDRVFKLTRVYYADEDPINHTTTYLPYKYIDGIEKFDFSKASLYDVLENKYDIHITHAVRTIEAVIPPAEIASSLQIEIGVPLLRFHCITYGAVRDKKIPIECVSSYYRSDKFAFSINQVR